VSGPDAVTRERWRQPVRVLIDIADRVLRADTVEACIEAGIEVADAAAQDMARDMAQDMADVALIDRPVATAAPAIALAADGTRRAWPANVCAVIPADTDAETLAAIVAVVAAGYAVTARREDGADSEDSNDDAGGDAGNDGGAWSAAGDSAGEPGRTLSSREREVLALLAGGASNKEIALALGLSVSTVKFHVAAIVAKLGARSRVDAVAIAVRGGLVMV
jgi:DNA-binding NarL/FixJ family response regulator